MHNFQKLDELKARLDGFRPLDRDVLLNLHEDMVLRWTYNSNAIEGNTLSLKETKVVLEGITIGGKTLREHFEAINHRDAIFFVEELAAQNTVLTESDIKALHQLILRNIEDQNAGKYRQINVIISGAEHVPPDALHVPGQMKEFFNWVQTDAQGLHPVERAARIHSDFVKIHPFVDGNGRTARLLMNLELLKAGFPSVILPVETRLAYYEALDIAHTTDNCGPFIDLVMNAVEASFKPYWHALGVTSTNPI